MSRWEEYLSKVKAKPGKQVDVQDVSRHFPFHKYFSNAPQPVFKEQSYEEDMDIAEGCFRHIKKIFTQLEYDNILMEEAAQILEIETFIPLLLQNPEDGFSRLKRWIMIGDHHQLPPVIKNMAFQKYSNMEQSLFTRFVRLGVPTVDLDAQGRARASLCNLYNWRYKQLGNLPHVQLLPEFRSANAGLAYDFQLINVEDFNGVGESEPNPYFYQVTTVDRFQGQQNDYIILSLVRTKAVGHLRDVRRLVVAMSRARLGLYIFARVSLFQNCFELTPAFNQLAARPLLLHIVPNEYHPTNRLQQQLLPPPRQLKVEEPVPNPVGPEEEEEEEEGMETEEQAQAKKAEGAKEEPEEMVNIQEEHHQMPEHPGRDSDSEGEDDPAN
ncbi:UNVERIFIED_CONTAM: hypothetical protein FKN15_011638 [Acipenser sinensis]